MTAIRRNRKMWAVVLLVLAMVMGTAVVHALLPVDTFNDTTQTSDLGTPCTSASTPGTDIINSERDILVNRTSGGGTVVADVDSTVADHFSLSIGASTRGTALIQWDGADGNCTLNDRGLAPLSLSPDDGLAIYVRSVDLNGAVQMRVYTDASNYSTYSYIIPNAVVAPGYIIYFPFEQFTDVGAGANFADVGAIELLVDGTSVDSLDITIDFINSDLTRDFGDLPSAYNNITLFANDGARHIPGTTYFGTVIDTDADGQTSGSATGDDTDGTSDEDGLDAVTGSDWGDGGGQIDMTVTTDAFAACVVGWIDWDGSGSFDVGGTTGGVSELVYNSYGFDGSNALNITTPTVANYGGSYPATLNARFRAFVPNADLFSNLGLALDGFGCPTSESEANIQQLLNGLARNGEVEDYQWGFTPTAVSLQSISANSATPFQLATLIGGLLLVVLGGGALLYRRQNA